MADRSPLKGGFNFAAAIFIVATLLTIADNPQQVRFLIWSIARGVWEGVLAPVLQILFEFAFVAGGLYLLFLLLRHLWRNRRSGPKAPAKTMHAVDDVRKILRGRRP